MNSKIKNIVILVHNLTGGGAERVAALWASGFATRGYNVTVITTSGKEGDLTYELPFSVNHVVIEPPVSNRVISALFVRSFLWRLYFSHKLNRVLHRIMPDLCIGVMGKYALYAYNCTRDIGCKIINTEHNAYDRPEFFRTRPDIIKMKYETNKIFDRVTVLSEADTKVPGVPVDNMVVLPNPLTFNTASFVPEKEKIVLAVGRLDVWKVKGFDNLIRAWGRVADLYPDWKLIIVGNGSEDSKRILMNMSVEHHVEKQILFSGFCTNIIDYYRKASIFVLSSRYEGFGMALTEAMSQGCACIACDFNGRQREIIQNDSQGIICSNDNYIELSDALNRMIKDDFYRKECGINAIERSKYYSLENTIDRWEKIFKSL